MYISPENVILQDKEQSVIPSKCFSRSPHFWHKNALLCFSRYLIVQPIHTHTVACAMMIILRGKEALSRRNDAIYWQPRLFIMAQDREWWSRQLHISRDGSSRLDNNSTGSCPPPNHPSFSATTALKITDFEEKNRASMQPARRWLAEMAALAWLEWSLTAVAAMILLELPILSGSTWQLMSIACNTQWLKFAHRRCFFSMIIGTESV